MPSIPSNAPVWVWVFAIIVSGGGLGYIRDWVKQRRITAETPRPVRERVASNTAVDSSLTVVAKARDELADDNNRVREALAEERENAMTLRGEIRTSRAEHARDREHWDREREGYLTRIRELEARQGELAGMIKVLRDDLEREQ
jgi:hypothetical protein